MTGGTRPEPAAPAEQLSFYADLLPARLLARLAALPEGPRALATEIDALRALLQAVAGDPELGSAERMAAFARGVDSLGRLYRLRHLLEPDAADGRQALIDAALIALGLGPGEPGP